MADIWHDEQAGAWLLRMRSTSYAFGIVNDGAALRHLHWGADLPPRALAGLLAEAGSGPSRWERHRAWALELPDEYVPWGGMRYDEKAIRPVVQSTADTEAPRSAGGVHLMAR